MKYVVVWVALGLLVTISLPALAQDRLIDAVTASSFADGRGPENTLDNDFDTRWAARGLGEWIQFDLGEMVTVTQVFIAWFRGDKRRATFRIEVSLDARAWTEVFRGDSSGRALFREVYDFSEVTARFVRIVGFGNTDDEWISITEAGVHGPLPGGTRLEVVDVRASGFDTQNMTIPENAIDRKLATRWSSLGLGEWIQFDLGEAITVSQVFIAWFKEGFRQAEFAILMSLDAANWTTVVPRRLSSGLTPGFQAYESPDVMARFVRIEGYGNTENSQPWHALTEVEIHGDGEQSPVNIFCLLPLRMAFQRLCDQG